MVAPTPKQSPTSGLDLGNFDRTVRPQDDLFRAANGRWLARTPVPPDRVTHGTFVELSDKTETDLRAIIENVEAQRDRQRGTARQIADLYASLMDETRAEELGFQPITELLRRIDAIRTPRDDRGRRLDGAGAALDWWTTGDKQAFAAKAQALVEQFKAYNAPEGARGNGQEGTDLVGLRAQEEPSSPGSEPR